MVMQHVPMLIVDCARTIGAHAAEVQVIELLAVLAQAACARYAVPAAAIGQYHMIVYLQVLQLGAD